MAVETGLAIFAGVAGVVTSVYAFYVWLRNGERQRIESERRLSHALSNFAQVSTAIAELNNEIEQMTLELAQIKMLMSLPADNSKIRGVRRG